jgi:hypothetical protein
MVAARLAKQLIVRADKMIEQVASLKSLADTAVGGGLVFLLFWSNRHGYDVPSDTRTPTWCGEGRKQSE